jgi:hypothetical protein
METNTASADSGNGAAPAAAPESTTWYGSFDQETSGWLENRGLTKLDEKAAIPELVKGFRNAEKYIGTPADKLVKIPDWDKADKVELDQIYQKLGRPNDPKEYKLPVPDGQPRDFADWAEGVFHEAGLSARQAAAVTNKWNEYVGGMVEGETASKQQMLKDQESGLRSEWGQAYDKYDTIAANAITSLGIEDKQLAAIRDSLGFDGAMKLFAKIGEKLGEPDYHSGDSRQGNSGPLTPAQAVSKISALQSDKEWVGKYLAGNVESRAEMERLMKIAYPS